MREKFSDIKIKKVSVGREIDSRPSSNSYREPIKHSHIKHEIEEKEPEVIERPRRNKSSNKNFFRKNWLKVTLPIVAVSVFVIAFALSLLVHEGKIIIKAKKVQVSVTDKQIILAKTPKAGELGFEVMTVTKSASLPVDATFVATSGKKATGIVTLFNNYSTVPQTIIANSRLVNTKGVIYRTTKAVVIPGYKMVNGKKTPGSIDVRITADKIGEDSNIKFEDLSGDFVLPGLETNPEKYKLVFGRQKTDIIGGTSGGEYKVSSTTSGQAKASLISKLTTELTTSYRNQIPKDYMSPNTMYSISFETADFKSLPNNKVDMTIKGTLQAMIIKNDTLGRFIAGGNLDTFKGTPVLFDGLDKLDFKLDKPINNLSAELNIKTRINGQFKIIGDIQVDNIKKAFAGHNVNDTMSLIPQFPAIDGVQLHMTPLWFKTIPEDVNKIVVEIQQ